MSRPGSCRLLCWTSRRWTMRIKRSDVGKIKPLGIVCSNMARHHDGPGGVVNLAIAVRFTGRIALLLD